MSLGFDVTKQTLDAKTAQAALRLRESFDQIETIAKWLANHPNPGPDNTNDPLVTDFGYSTDEAYVLRNYFETFDGVRTANQATFDVGRKLTGLE